MSGKFIFCLLILYVKAFEYTTSDPEGFYFNYPTQSSQITLPGQSTSWNYLEDCTKNVGISYCQSNLPLIGYTSLLKLTNFGFPKYGNEYTVTGLQTFITYTITSIDTTFEFMNLVIRTNNPNNFQTYTTNSTMTSQTTCCAALYLGNSTNTLGMTLRGDDLPNISMEFAINRMTGSTTRYPRIHTIGIKAYFSFTSSLTSISPNLIIDGPDLPTIRLQGIGLIPLPNKPLLCRLNNYFVQCVALSSKIVFALLPTGINKLPFNNYNISISIDGGDQWSHSSELFTYRQANCAGEYLPGVSCVGSNSSLTGRIYIPGQNIHQISDIIAGEGSGFFGEDVTVDLSGSLLVKLDKKPCNGTITLNTISVKNLRGNFDRVALEIPDVKACENPQVEQIKDASSLSVVVNMNNNCPEDKTTLIIAVSVSVVCGIALAIGATFTTIYIFTKRLSKIPTKNIDIKDYVDT